MKQIQAEFKPEDNKYFKWYWNICNRAVGKLLPDGTYTEKHHIYPKSIYGQNKLLVKLTAKEHRFVHLVLWQGLKAKYGIKDVRTRKMASGFVMINMVGKGQQRRKLNNGDEYTFLKLARSEAMKGKKASPETRKKMSEALKNPSVETRKKISEAYKGRKRSAETKKKMSEAKKGHTNSAETKKKMSEAQKNRPPISEETRKKMIESRQNISAETKKKISEAGKGRPVSAETKKKISEARKLWWKKKKAAENKK